MTSFTVHTLDTAPAAARPAMEAAKKAFGLVPNLIGVFAESPAVAEGYLGLAGAFGKSSFTALERETVLIATSVENECHYCVAAHTTVTQGQKLDQSVIAAIRERRAIDDPRLEALRQFTIKLVQNRGFVSDGDVSAFHAAGFTHAQVLEAVMGVSLKVMSNYVNHIAATPLDAPFQANAWTPRRAAA
jgi:uncharacterized peroxidase-related enzyme